MHYLTKENCVNVNMVYFVYRFYLAFMKGVSGVCKSQR